MIRLLTILLCLIAVPAIAQQTMYLGGNWTTGNVPKFSTQTYNGAPMLQDSGLIPGTPISTVVGSLPSCGSHGRLP